MYSDMRVPRSDHVCAEFNGSIYVIGGKQNNSAVLNSVEILDLLSRNWASGPDLPEQFEVTGSHIFKYLYKLYLIGGNGQVLFLDANKAEWIIHTTIGHRVWSFLPSAFMKAGHCLSGMIIKL